MSDIYCNLAVAFRTSELSLVIVLGVVDITHFPTMILARLKLTSLKYSEAFFLWFIFEYEASGLYLPPLRPIHFELSLLAFLPLIESEGSTELLLD